jgi:5-formyltetrahydrofolate cyclo-ligase
MGGNGVSVKTVKDEWRNRVLAARRELSADARDREATSLAERVAKLGHAGQTVCCYVPVGTEPGSPAMLDALAARGVRVLLPVVTGLEPLDWAAYTGPDSLVPGPFGLREPTGAPLGPHALAEADLVLVPALAVDRTGIRLGRGAGHYDRSLPLVDRDTPVIAVVRDDELVDRLPAEAHDVRMTSALAPGRGLVTLSS